MVPLLHQPPISSTSLVNVTSVAELLGIDCEPAPARSTFTPVNTVPLTRELRSSMSSDSTFSSSAARTALAEKVGGVLYAIGLPQ